jgi:thioredoxin 1
MAVDLNESNFQDAIKSASIAVVDFWAEWCMPCKLLEPVMEEIEAKLRDKMSFFRVNVDENPSLAAKYGIEGVPTLVIFKNGKPIDEIVGFRPFNMLYKELTAYLQ